MKRVDSPSVSGTLSLRPSSSMVRRARARSGCWSGLLAAMAAPSPANTPLGSSMWKYPSSDTTWEKSSGCLSPRLAAPYPPMEKPAMPRWSRSRAWLPSTAGMATLTMNDSTRSAPSTESAHSVSGWALPLPSGAATTKGDPPDAIQPSMACASPASNTSPGPPGRPCRNQSTGKFELSGPGGR